LLPLTAIFDIQAAHHRLSLRHHKFKAEKPCISIASDQFMLMAAQSVATGETKMTIFTIDNDNNITAFATAEAANAASTTPFDLFTNQKELAELLAGWPAERLVATYNSLPGVKPVKALKDPKTAASKIWERVEKLGQMVAPEPVAAKPEAAPAKPKAGKKAKGGAQSAKGAPTKGKAPARPPPRRPLPPRSRAQGQEGREGAGSQRAARGQQDGRGDCDAAAQGRGQDFGDHADHGLAASHRPRVHGRRDEEGGIHGRESFKPEGGERSYRLPK
jgi:hypothetical protein